MDVDLIKGNFKRWKDINSTWNDKKYDEIQMRYFEPLSGLTDEIDELKGKVEELNNYVDSRIYEILGGSYVSK